MPYKLGGGNHLQYYDEIDGQYGDERKKSQCEDDMTSLTMVYCFGLDNENLVFHWPKLGVHDDEYCSLFVQYSKQRISGMDVDIRKCAYLMKYDAGRDKSRFLSELGYDSLSLESLRNDIISNTDLQILNFSRLISTCLKCVAKTELHGKIVTTVWELKKDYKIRLITLIPGDDKKWK